jgi:arsenate reductase
MAKIGIDIAARYGKATEALADIVFDAVSTACDHTLRSCLRFSARAQIIRHASNDSPRLARDAPTEVAAMNCYRYLRDKIGEYVRMLPQRLI